MTPDEEKRLKVIEGAWGNVHFSDQLGDDLWWLVARVRELDDALHGNMDGEEWWSRMMTKYHGNMKGEEKS